MTETNSAKLSKVDIHQKKQKLIRQKEELSFVPFATGFKPPTRCQSRLAIGCEPMMKDFDPGAECSHGFEYFKTIPRPTDIDDWLAQYNEEGQTYKQFLNECPWLSSRKRKYMSQTFVFSGKTLPQKYPDGKVYIVPLGEFQSEDPKFFDHLIEYTSIFLGLPVVPLPVIQLREENGDIFWIKEPLVSEALQRRTSSRMSKQKLTTRYDFKSKHFQVCVDSCLMKLRQKIPSDAICLIALTMFDLYGDETDLFVAGMAAGNQRVAVFSLYRYDPSLSFSKENWYEVEPDKTVSKKDKISLLLQRGSKLLVHEICHLLGIDHCIYFDCCMNGSGHLAEDFRQSMHLCPVDLHKLHILVGFDVVERT
ncbi:hypothetical protein CHS0354_036811 [Potamilus streckersoni]|uniref:Archaemetzincin-2 n=1 Tax=Potamilus streckersoni TaxID=2493646 RepID=A0AAE0VXL8_9BIVA|nr:hypothetical protein CHS0354_036811 [Potamilus streckersoni]